MSTNKLAPEYISNLKKLKEDYNNLIFNAGQAAMRKKALQDELEQIDDTLDEAQAELRAMQAREKQLLSDIREEYGAIEIDLTDGTYTEVPESPEK